MGQLERYGLYVLCLIIFLVLGVSVWGSEPRKPDHTSPVKPNAELNLGKGDKFAKGGQQRSQPKQDSDEVMLQRHQDFFANRSRPQPTGTGDSADRIESLDSVESVEPAETIRPERSESKYRYHKVVEGDVMEELARDYLGSRAAWKRISRLNPKVIPTKLRPGMVLKIPPRQRSAKSSKASKRKTSKRSVATWPSGVPKTFKVRRGDNPAKISKRLFRTETYADEIMALNNIEDERGLQIGQVLRIPNKPKRR